MGRLVVFSLMPFQSISNSNCSCVPCLYICLCYLVVAFQTCVRLPCFEHTCTFDVWHKGKENRLHSHIHIHTFANVYKLHGTPSSSICHHGYHQFNPNHLFILNVCSRRLPPLPPSSSSSLIQLLLS